jgi:hypothetical protein
VHILILNTEYGRFTRCILTCSIADEVRTTIILIKYFFILLLLLQCKIQIEDFAKSKTVELLIFQELIPLIY